MRADKWQSDFGDYVSIEAKSDAGAAAHAYRKVGGGSITLFPFVDAGVYLYHRRSTGVTSLPTTLTVTSDLGGSDSASFTEWLPDQDTQVGLRERFRRSLHGPH